MQYKLKVQNKVKNNDSKSKPINYCQPKLLKTITTEKTPQMPQKTEN